MSKSPSGYRHFTVIYVFLLTVLSYLASAKGFYNADAAFGPVMAQDFASGNFLFKNWILSTQPYFTTDYLYQGILAFFFAPQRIAFLMCTIILVLSFVSMLHCMKKTSTSKESLFIFFSYLYFIAGVQGRIGDSPSHAMTIIFSVFAVAAFYAARKNIVIFSLCAVIALTGDSYAGIYLIAPIAFEAMADYFTTKRKDYSVLYLIPVVAASLLFRKLAIQFGYNVPGIPPLTFVEPENLSHNFFLFFAGLLEMFHASFLGKQVLQPTGIMRFSLFLMLLYLLYAHYWAFKHRQGRFVRFLLISSLCQCVAYLLLNIPTDIYSGRYLTGVFYNGCILMCFHAASFSEHVSIKRLQAASALLLTISIFLAAFVLPQNKNSVEDAAVSQLLIDHNMTSGIAPYWSSYNVSLWQNGKKVIIAPVQQTGKSFTSFDWLTNRKWYTQEAYFFIWNRERYPDISQESVINFFGEPYKILSERNYSILLYQTNIMEKLMPATP